MAQLADFEANRFGKTATQLLKRPADSSAAVNDSESQQALVVITWACDRSASRGQRNGQIMKKLALAILFSLPMAALGGSAHADVFTFPMHADKAAGWNSSCWIDSTTAFGGGGVQYGELGYSGVIGGLRCAGGNNYGQLGIGSADTLAHPTAVTPIGMTSGVHAVAMATATVCALKNNQVYCWGYRADGETGDGSATISPQTTPTLVPNSSGTGFVNSNVTELVAGAGHFCAIKDHDSGTHHYGHMWCWGWNDNGQLGYVFPGISQVPQEVFSPGKSQNPNGTALWQGWMAAGWQFTCATGALLIGNAPLACWGDNQFGQLGDNTTTDHTLPAYVALANDSTTMNGNPNTGQVKGVIQDMGSSQTTLCVALDRVISGGASRSMYCWGDNQYGELGINTTSTTPQKIPLAIGRTSVWSISNGNAAVHFCIRHLESVGNNVYCWGNNGYGQSADGSTHGDTNTMVHKAAAYFSTPTGWIYGSSDSSRIATGAYHTLYTNTSSTAVFGFGSDCYGEAMSRTAHLTDGGPASCATNGWITWNTSY